MRGALKLVAQLLLLCCLVSICVSEKSKCPSTGDVDPCTCKEDYDGACILQCYAVNTAALKKVSSLPNLCNGNIYFILVHSNVTALPTALWKILLTSKKVDITFMYSAVQYLVAPDDTPLPHDLNSPGEAFIKIEHSKDITKWQWEQLKSFTPGQGMSIIIDDTPLKKITDGFSHIAGGAVKKVVVDGASLETLPNEAFASFQSLASLALQNNELTEVKRSMFPTPAPKLQYFHLNGNKLKTIPNDLFTEMPSLRIIYLRDNLLSYLSETLLLSMNANNLNLIDLSRNPWHCNCELLATSRRSRVHLDMGKCASPPHLKDLKVENLSTVLNCGGFK